MDACEQALDAADAVPPEAEPPPEALPQPASPAAVTAASAAASTGDRSTKGRMVQPPHQRGRARGAPGEPLAGQPTGRRRPAQALSRRSLSGRGAPAPV